MSKFIQELKRRNVIKASITYVVVSWAILQVAAIVFPIIEFGPEAMRVLLVTLIIGFPLWVVFAYFFELTPDGFKKTSATTTNQSVHRSTSKRLNGIIIGGLSLAVILLIGDRIINLGNSEKIDQLDKSIAVLPFINLSNDPSQEYFSEGLTNDILTQLAKIDDFKVISRTSVMQYKDDRPSIKSIGEQLNVGLVLEGSVQRSGDQLRINSQLINASTEEHIWAESYDRPVDELFAIQMEVATAIAQVLRTQLSPEETERLLNTPTDNIEAYQLYQRGLYFLSRPHFEYDQWLEAIGYFEDAVAEDSTFAEAYGQMARAHARIYYLRRDHTLERLESATKSVEKALSLASGNPEVQLSAGYYQLWARRDKAAALSYFEQASEGLPNSTEILEARARIYEGQGRFDDLINAYKLAVELSPLDGSYWSALAIGHEFTYQFDLGLEAITRATALEPDANWNHLCKAFIYFSSTGAGDESRAALKHVDSDHSWKLWSSFHQEMFEGKFEDALLLIDQYPDGVDNKMTRIPQSMLKAYMLDYLNKNEEASIEYSRAIDTLTVELENDQNDDRLHSAIGIAYAALGYNEEAIEHGKRAMELIPLAEEALYGQPAVLDMALIYTITGEFDLAFDHLEIILSKPSYWSTTWLEGDVRYAPLKQHSRFADLVAKYKK